MGLRFQRRFSLIPGLRLNLSKSGASLSLGKRGSWLNFGGRRKPSVSLGLPGSGLRWTQPLGNHAHHDPAAAVVPAERSTLARVVRAVLWLTVLAIAAVLVARLIPP
jgi:Protein of unknown function (DUF4236)